MCLASRKTSDRCCFWLKRFAANNLHRIAGSEEQIDLSTVFCPLPQIVFPAAAGLGGPLAALSES